MSKHKNTVHLKNLGTPRRTFVPSATTPTAKNKAREKIQREIDDYLKAGGTIDRPDLQSRTGKGFSYHGSDIKNGKVG